MFLGLNTENRIEDLVQVPVAAEVAGRSNGSKEGLWVDLETGMRTYSLAVDEAHVQHAAEVCRDSVKGLSAGFGIDSFHVTAVGARVAAVATTTEANAVPIATDSSTVGGMATTMDANASPTAAVLTISDENTSAAVDASSTISDENAAVPVAAVWTMGEAHAAVNDENTTVPADAVPTVGDAKAVSVPVISSMDDAVHAHVEVSVPVILPMDDAVHAHVAVSVPVISPMDDAAHADASAVAFAAPSVLITQTAPGVKGCLLATIEAGEIVTNGAKADGGTAEVDTGMHEVYSLADRVGIVAVCDPVPGLVDCDNAAFQLESDDDSDADFELELERQRAIERMEKDSARERRLRQTRSWQSVVDDDQEDDDEEACIGKMKAKDRLILCSKLADQFTTEADAELLKIVENGGKTREARLQRRKLLEGFIDGVRKSETGKAKVSVTRLSNEDGSFASICARMTSSLEETRFSPTSVRDLIPCCSGSPFMLCSTMPGDPDVVTSAENHSGNFKKRKADSGAVFNFLSNGEVGAGAQRKRMSAASIAAATSNLIGLL